MTLEEQVQNAYAEFKRLEKLLELEKKNQYINVDVPLLKSIGFECRKVDEFEYVIIHKSIPKIIGIEYENSYVIFNLENGDKDYQGCLSIGSGASEFEAWCNTEYLLKDVHDGVYEKLMMYCYNG